VTEAELLRTMREILCKEFEVAEASLRPDARLREDLDLDSLDAVVLATRLEEETGLVIDDDLASSIRTFQDILDGLRPQLQRRNV
jgi:acyl carrier protein